MTWKPDPRSEKTLGPVRVVSETNQDKETAHLITFPTGKQIRVLPDGHSGHMRAKLVREALGDLEGIAERLGDDLGFLDTFFRGAIAAAGLTWEEVSLAEVTIEEWLEHYFSSELVLDDDSHAPDEVKHFLKALAADGWEIRRGDE